MRIFAKYLFVLFLLLLSLIVPNKVHAAITTVHDFAGMPSDGGNPCDLSECSLILDNGVFYGVAEEGGDDNFGVVFKLNTDGSGYTILHEFTGGLDDGAQPKGKLILSGSILYGVTNAGGDSDYGTVYKINTNGTGFALLHEFDLTQGANPSSAPVLVGSTLYGSTSGGGSPQDGVLYKVDTDGTGFSVIKEFESSTDGAMLGGIIIDSGVIYGMTSSGGTSNKGTIYKINVNGTGFSALRQFSGVLTNGAIPYGSLIMYQSKLYGMTNEGGASNLGSIFRINTDGSGFSLLHSFTGSAGQGQYPGGGLIENNGIFYGMTYYGGASDMGTIFEMNADGSGFSTLHQFAGGVSDGQYSNGNLFFNTLNSRLYGMTVYGGTTDNGIIFYYQTAVPTPTPTPTPSPTPTNSPTPTPGSGSNPSTSSGSDSSSPTSTACTKQAPGTSPNLFQVNTTSTTATLYFSPAENPYNSYYISFGNGNSDQGYGVSFNQGQTSGVITYKVLNLSPNSAYSFKVRAANGCMPGNWSKTLMTKTTNSNKSVSKFYPQSFINYSLNYTLPNAVQKIKNNLPLMEKQPNIKNKTVTGVKKVIPQKTTPKENKSLIDKIFGWF